MSAGGADEFLVREIKAGSQDAWRQLIERFQGRLLAFARSRAPSLADADDLVQETFVGFLQSLAHYDAARSLETYLFTILRYKLYDSLRQRKATMVREPEQASGFWEAVLPPESETPSAAALLAEAADRSQRLLSDLLRRLIHELRDRQAFTDLQVIELIFFAGWRNLDVAELLDVDQKAVAGIKFRAIQKLQRFLEDVDADVAMAMDDANMDVTVARVWQDHRLTCLKRSTLGSYLLGVLEEPWKSYTQFHLDVVGCALCVANLQDLAGEQSGDAPPPAEKFFQSSVGFLKTQGK